MYNSLYCINLSTWDIHSPNLLVSLCFFGGVLQDDYKSQEKIGILDCGHEYHANCLQKWLLVKNVCPICKSEALTTGGKHV